MERDLKTEKSGVEGMAVGRSVFGRSTRDTDENILIDRYAQRDTTVMTLTSFNLISFNLTSFNNSSEFYHSSLPLITQLRIEQ